MVATTPYPSPSTPNQIPDQAIMDLFGKQAYLANAYLSCIPLSTTTTSETGLVLFSNPAGTGKAMFMGLRKLLCQTASQSLTAKFYITPTISAAGSAAAPNNQRPGNTQQSTISAVTTGPTVTTKGTLFDELYAAAGDPPDVNPYLIILDPGQSLLMTATPSQNVVAFTLTSAWYEL